MDVGGSQAYLTWLVGRDYEDGALNGIGERRRDRKAVAFSVVAMHLETLDRLYAMAVTKGQSVEQFLSINEMIEPRRLPVWILGEKAHSRLVSDKWSEIRNDSPGTWLAVHRSVREDAPSLIRAFTAMKKRRRRGNSHSPSIGR